MTELTAQDQMYLARVNDLLSDLSAHERTEHLNELSVHMRAMREDSDTTPAIARFGTPAQYVQELRSAAGIKATNSRKARWLTPALMWAMIATANSFAAVAVFLGVSSSDPASPSKSVESAPHMNTGGPLGCVHAITWVESDASDAPPSLPTAEEVNQQFYKTMTGVVIGPDGREIGRFSQC